MKRQRYVAIGGVLLALGIVGLLTPLSAQVGDFLTGTEPGDTGGPVGTVDDGDDPFDPADQVPGWTDLDEEQWGPLGQVDEYEPHPACEMCFTLPAYDEYQINEYAASDRSGGAIIITREIPNPAPEILALEEYDHELGGIMEDGDLIWFIGTRGITGPTDEEKWSDELPVSTIEMKRIQARHIGGLEDIPGVDGLGIGERGFRVRLLSKHKENLDQIPEDLEGVPLEVIIIEGNGLYTLASHTAGNGPPSPPSPAPIRPIPAGISISVGSTGGTLGPHVIRDEEHSVSRSCCEMYSLTAGQLAGL